VGYTFDAFSRTITRTQGSVTTTFAYEGISEILARSVTGTTATTYAHTPGGPLGERVGTGTPTLYLRDLHSDIVGTVDGTSTTPLSRAYYSPWGEPTWSTTAPALGFQGQYTDAGTGFVDMTTRSYVPELGRFASRDIVFGGLRHPLSLNQWAYALNDPVSAWDFSGLGCSSHTGDHKCHNNHPHGDTRTGGDKSGGTTDPDGPGPQQEPTPTASPAPAYTVEEYLVSEALCQLERCSEQFLNSLQSGLAVCGFVPLLGDFVCDPADAAVSTARGDWLGVGLDAAGIVPLFGGWADGADAARSLDKMADTADLARRGDLFGWMPSPKHLPDSAGNWSKFAEGVVPGQALRDGLLSPRSYMGWQEDGRLRIIADVGRTIGTRGETSIRIVIARDGTIVTAFPQF
jgi:RHS repeat-associated protein